MKNMTANPPKVVKGSHGFPCGSHVIFLMGTRFKVGFSLMGS